MSNIGQQIKYLLVCLLFLILYLFVDLWITYIYLDNLAFEVIQQHIWQATFPLVLGVFLRRNMLFSLFKKGKLRFSWPDAILSLLPWCLLFNHYIWMYGGTNYIGLLSGYFAAGIVSKTQDEA